MGLDVYLYRYEDREMARAVNEAYEQRSERIWDTVKKEIGCEEIHKLPEEQRKVAYAKVEALQTVEAQALGMVKGEYGFDPPGELKIEIDSPKYPEHYFKIGYFRSSYNSGGIERVAGDLIGESPLHYIFPQNDDYEFSPDWADSLVRVQEMLSRFDEATKDGSFRCNSVDIGMFSSPEELKRMDAHAAMATFLEERKKTLEKDQNKVAGFDFSNYSNKAGEFAFGEEPYKVRGMIPGANVLGIPCIHIIYEDNSISWYRQALEIVEETIQWVMSQEDPQKFYLHWSG